MGDSITNINSNFESENILYSQHRVAFFFYNFKFLNQ